MVPYLRSLMLGVLLSTSRTLFGYRGITVAFLSPRSTSTTTNTTKQTHHPRSSTALYDQMTDVEVGQRDILWFDEVDSTMEKAKQLLKDPEFATRDAFCVVAGSQSAGRGTRGRTWMSSQGNLYMTAVLKLSLIPIPLTLIPLRVGTFIAPSIKSRVENILAPVVLKWPNDVLIGDRKVCGVLIEIEQDRVLVGIGCNVQTAPLVEQSGQQYGRLATCVRDHGVGSTQDTSSSSSSCGTHNDDTCPNQSSSEASTAATAATATPLTIATPPAPSTTAPATEQISFDQPSLSTPPPPPSSSLSPHAHKEIAAEIFHALSSWLTRSSKDTTEAVLTDFQRDMDRSPQKLRGELGPGEQVLPLRLNKDGTLVVRVIGGADDGTERMLVADYLL